MNEVLDGDEGRSWASENCSRSVMRAMEPSSFMISQITPAGLRPAICARSMLPSVCPVRCSTPPGRARSGNTCPGDTRSSGFASGETATRMVCARSAAEIPVETPSRASMLTVNAVPREARFFSTIIGRRSSSQRSSVRVRQMRPRACFAMKLIASGVTFSAASTMSPSFSRSSSSVRITMRPSRIASTARRTRSSGVPGSVIVVVSVCALNGA
ncbi:MAG: hypothetical protein R3A48_20820 [Polyangiales bacterium]